MPVKTETIWGDRAAKAVLLIRILAGWVFLSKDIQKFSSRTPSEADAL